MIYVKSKLFNMILKKSLKFCTGLRHYSGRSSSPRLVLGCGSNVVDQFFMVQGIAMSFKVVVICHCFEWSLKQLKAELILGPRQSISDFLDDMI